jgi:hypothetical protein
MNYVTINPLGLVSVRRYFDRKAYIVNASRIYRPSIVGDLCKL